jgi:flagellar biosynthesis/type III secretory pathway protein FliH
MSLRFRPPPLAGFFEGDGADHAAALLEARDQGFAEGHAKGVLEGHAAGVADGEARTRGVLLPELDALQESSAKRDRYDTVAVMLRRLLEGRERDLTALEVEVRETVTAALRTLFPVLLSQAIGTEIASLAATALMERTPETLTLRAHPETLAAVSADTREETEKGRLVLAPDPRRAFGSVEIAWTGGGMTFDPAALLSQVTAALGVETVPATVPTLPNELILEPLSALPGPPKPNTFPEIPLPENSFP